jgi:hypothetical protein
LEGGEIERKDNLPWVKKKRKEKKKKKKRHRPE